MTGKDLTANIRVVPVGEMVSSAAPDDVLVAYGLGSCVVICLYDPLARIGGMLHALLPTQPDGVRHQNSPTRFVDQGTPLLIDALLGLGARRTRLQTYLCGGAQMIFTPNLDDGLNVGDRNVLAAQVALQAAGLRIQAQATGGNIGRTVRLYMATGQVTVKTMEHDEKTLNVKR